MDLYKHYFNPQAGETQLVQVGRIVALLAFGIAALVAPALGALDQAFQFIQEYTGFVSPGVFAIFVFGFFWKRTTANAALFAAIATIPLSTLFKFVTPGLPFIDRMGLVFVIIAVGMVLISYLDPRSKDNPKGIALEPSLFRTSMGFNIGAVGIVGILAALYTIFW
jgi:SSS family solute:Na+ symporter